MKKDTPNRRLQYAVVLLSFLAVGGAAYGQRTAAASPKPRFATGTSVRNLPLDIDNNIIRMKVRINDSRPLTMIFDTGADITCIHPRVVKELGLPTGQLLKGVGTGGKIQGNLAGKAKLSVDGADVADQPLFSLNFEGPPGFEFDGIIGYDFIKAFVVEIDYQKKTMSLFDPTSYRYRGKGVTVPLNLEGRNTPLVRTSFVFPSSGPVVGRLELDTGADGAFQLNSPIAKEHRLLDRLKGVTPSTGHGAGGEERRVITQSRSITFGGFTFLNVPVGISLDEEGGGGATDNDGIIGGEILRRFRVIIDYSRRRMILERNSSFNDPFGINEG